MCIRMCIVTPLEGCTVVCAVVYTVMCSVLCSVCVCWDGASGRPDVPRLPGGVVHWGGGGD